jgi:hypothetical protein
MIDITGTLVRLRDQVIEWPIETARAIAYEIADVIEATVDWDSDAGEEWLSVLAQEERVVMVSSERPIVVAVRSLHEIIPSSAQEAYVVFVPSFGDSVLRCDASVLGALFAGEGRAMALNPDAFSANDLWFATV